MININCDVATTVLLGDLVPFQGNLKKRTDEDITNLARSINTEGLCSPFYVWKHNDKNYVLDGHGRMQALIRMSLLDSTLLNQPLPCIYISADTEEKARQILLQFTSSYGKVTKAGLKHFTATIPTYTAAPVLAKFKIKETKVHTPKVKVESVTVEPEQEEIISDDKIVLKIKLPKVAEKEVRDILAECPFIEVL